MAAGDIAGFVAVLHGRYAAAQRRFNLGQQKAGVRSFGGDGVNSAWKFRFG